MVSPTPLKNSINIWERARRRFRLDLGKFKNKSEINEAIDKRVKTLDEIAKGQKTLKLEGKKFTPDKAEAEAKALRGFKRSISDTDAFEKVRNFRNIEVKGKYGTYIKSSHKWNTEEKRTIRANVSLDTKELRNILEAKFNRAYTPSSVSSMKSRIRAGKYV